MDQPPEEVTEQHPERALAALVAHLAAPHQEGVVLVALVEVVVEVAGTVVDHGVLSST